MQTCWLALRRHAHRSNLSSITASRLERARRPTNHGSGSIKRRSLHVGTLSATQDTSLDELIKHVSIPEGGEDDLALLLLLTPGFARLAKDDTLPGRFARSALNRTPSTLESVTAVIDSTSPWKDSEGVAYAICSRKSTPFVLTSTQLRSAANKPGSITFDFDARVRNATSQWDVQLPLAQTVFTTGLTSTLVHRVHERSASPDNLQLIAERYLETLSFSVRSEDTGEAQLKLDSFPLLPLTACQVVKESMGNIIRTVAPLRGGEKAQEEPASRRLEEAVTAYFTARDMAPEPVNVWAAIVPRDVIGANAVPGLDDILTSNTDGLQAVWTTEADQTASRELYSNLIPHLLAAGGRLVRVLSGGGGWGKKAGLLSLDPDLEYSTRELRDDFGWSFDFDDAAGDKETGSQLDQALGKSVEDGDALIFLIAPEPAGSNVDASIVVGKASSHLIFGTSMPGKAPSQIQAVMHSDALQAFSETGTAVKLISSGRLIGRSKLEVPGLALSVAC